MPIVFGSPEAMQIVEADKELAEHAGHKRYGVRRVNADWEDEEEFDTHFEALAYAREESLGEDVYQIVDHTTDAIDALVYGQEVYWQE